MESEEHVTACGHKFHNQCYIAHLLNSHDRRCPLCRADPNPELQRGHCMEDFVVSTRTHRRGPSISRALDDARKSRRPGVQRSLATIAKWRKATAQARSRAGEAISMLVPFEDELARKIELFRAKLTAKHEATHASKIKNREEANKILDATKKSCKSTQIRVAKRFGYRIVRHRR